MEVEYPLGRRYALARKVNGVMEPFTTVAVAGLTVSHDVGCAKVLYVMDAPLVDRLTDPYWEPPGAGHSETEVVFVCSDPPVPLLLGV